MNEPAPEFIDERPVAASKPSTHTPPRKAGTVERPQGPRIPLSARGVSPFSLQCRAQAPTRGR